MKVAEEIKDQEIVEETPVEEVAEETIAPESDISDEAEAKTEADAAEEATEEQASAPEQAEEEQPQEEATADSEAQEEPAPEQEAAKEETSEEPEEKQEEAKPKSDSKYKWYIIHAYSGFEKKVAAAIEEQAEKKDMADLFEEIAVPTESIVEIKKGKKVNTERKFFPGYVLAKMVMNDETWHLVKGTPKVTGFIGGDKNKPLPISEAEAKAIFDQVKEGAEAPRHKVTFQIGDSVKVIDGPFDSFIGSIEEVDEEREKLHVSVSIFGRPTPLELDYVQVEKS